MQELSLWLDNYDDIYSDFDSRNYLKRRISDDFLFELKTAMKYQERHINDLILLLPADKRDEVNEKMIGASLKEFFILQSKIREDRCRKKMNRGIALGLAGIIIMISNAIVGFKTPDTILTSILRVMLEPAGWFMIWASFDFLFYYWQDLKKERDFFRGLAEMGIHFKSS